MKNINEVLMLNKEDFGVFLSELSEESRVLLLMQILDKLEVVLSDIAAKFGHASFAEWEAARDKLNPTQR